jgi:hypothetical protein
MGTCGKKGVEKKRRSEKRGCEQENAWSRILPQLCMHSILFFMS